MTTKQDQLATRTPFAPVPLRIPTQTQLDARRDVRDQAADCAAWAAETRATEAARRRGWAFAFAVLIYLVLLAAAAVKVPGLFPGLGA